MTKIKIIKSPWFPDEEICDVEEAKWLVFSFPGALLWCDGREVQSYDELVQVISEERNRDYEFLEAMVILPLGGG
ncbi:hypothetical protein ACFLTP_07580 [Chloroflexota bacterium]